MSWVEGCGVYIPETRLKADDLMKFHGRKGKAGAEWMAVPDLDEDSITMGYEAAAKALSSAGLSGSDVGGLVWGSMSPPFGLKSAGTLLAKALAMPEGSLVVGLDSSTKLAGEAVITASSLVGSGACGRCLVVCSDYVPLWGGQALELPSSAGAAALLISSRGFAELVDWASYLGEVYDFWRLPGDKRPRYDFAAYSGAYLRAAERAITALCQKAGFEAKDLDRLVMHSPGAKLTAKAVKGLGMSERFSETVSPKVGNLFSPSLLFGLVEAFETGRAGDKIASVSYGSGSSDAMLWRLDRNAPSAEGGARQIEACMSGFRPISVARHQQVSGC